MHRQGKVFPHALTPTNTSLVTETITQVRVLCPALRSPQPSQTTSNTHRVAYRWAKSSTVEPAFSKGVEWLVPMTAHFLTHEK